jgi:predicted PurR-regulated permease PerM
MGAYFLEKNNEILYKRWIDLSMIVVNIAIAIVAIIALFISMADKSTTSNKSPHNQEQEQNRQKGLKESEKPIQPNNQTALPDSIRIVDSSRAKQSY